MEGVGETVKMAGGVTSTDFGQLISRVEQLILDSSLRNEVSEKVLKYAEEFSWRNQALRHFELAEQLCNSRVQRPLIPSPIVAEFPASRHPLLAK
jgi:hypothetical protein